MNRRLAWAGIPAFISSDSAPAVAEQESGSETAEWSWGHVPTLGLAAASGVALVAFANRIAAEGATWGDLPFFAGLLLIVLPIGARLLQSTPRGSERVSLVAILGIALYACKVVHDPLAPGGYDEYLHLRTAQDIISTHSLLAQNSLLTVSPSYPGMELVTAAITQLSGIGVYESGMLVLGVARMTFVLSLFFLFAMATGSSRVAGIAALVYMTNSHFLYFDAQFAYESLALPLAVVVMYLLVRRGHSGPARWLGLTTIAVLAIVGTVATHHVTAALLAVFLLLWAGVGLLMRRRDRARAGRMALLTGGLVVLWAVTVATATIGYLAPVISTAARQLLGLIAGNVDARQLFVSRAGDVAPLWERLVGSASAGVILLLLPLGLLVVLYRYRSVPIVVAFALLASAFPLTLLARFAPIGAEVASRTPEYLFLGIAPIIGLALARVAYRGRLGMIQMVGAGALLAILAVGGIMVGMPDWARLPGPYLVSADGRSIDGEGIAAATWTREVLGDHQTFIADRVNRLLLASYGHQDVVTTYETGVTTRRLFLSDQLGNWEKQIAEQANIQYVLADHRLTTGLPLVGHYFERGEEVVTGIHDTPLDPELLDKFDREFDISRVFDDGNIRIYDVSRFRPST